MINEIIIELILRYLNSYLSERKERVFHSEQFQRFLYKYSIDERDNDFAKLYVKAIVRYSLDNSRRKKYVHFFKNKQIINVFYSWLYEDISIEDLVSDIVSFNSSVSKTKKYFEGFDIETELKAFFEHFESVIRESQSAGNRWIVKFIESNFREAIKNRSEAVVNKYLTIIPSVDPNEVIGREGDLTMLKNRVDESRKAVLVKGVGGLGKTTLVKTYIYHFQHQYTHIGWVEYDNDLPASMVNDLGYLIDRNKCESNDDRLNEILIKLQNLKGRNLLVIDNAENSINKYMKYLPQSADWDVILTSRELLGQCEVVELQGLSLENAKKLFVKLCSKPQEEDSLLKFLNKIECHTLSVELFAKLLDTHWEIDTVAELNNRLDNLLNDELLRTTIDLDYLDQKSNVAQNLLFAFNLSRLNNDEELLRVLKRIVVLPIRAEGYNVKDLIELYGIETDQVTFFNSIKELHDLGWLTQHKRNVFSCHRLIRLVILKMSPVSLEDILPLVKNVIDRLDGMNYDNYIDVLSEWQAIAESVVKYSMHLDSKEIIDLRVSVASSYLWISYFEESFKLALDAFSSAVRVFGEKHKKTVDIYLLIADIFRMSNNYEEAKNIYEEVQKEYIEFIDKNPRNMYYQHYCLWNVYKHLGMLKSACEHYEKALFYVDNFDLRKDVHIDFMINYMRDVTKKMNES